MKNKNICFVIYTTNPFTKDYTMSQSMIWWYGILENLGYNVYYFDYNSYLKNKENFFKTIKEIKPYFTIFGAYSLIHPELEEIRNYTKLYVLQSDDRWRYDNFGKYWIPFIDGVITFEGDYNKYVKDGLNPKGFNKMRWAFNPNTMNLTDKIDKKYFISHTGGLHGNRIEIINEFKKKGINIYVNKTPNYKDTMIIWSSSIYSLCLTNNSLNTCRELKGRVVEIPNFCVLLTEPFPDMEDYYDIDKECIVFNNVDEAIEKINVLEKDNDTLNKIFISGKKRLWNNNNAYIEWNKILPNIDEDYKQIDVNKLLKEKHGKICYD